MFINVVDRGGICHALHGETYTNEFQLRFPKAIFAHAQKYVILHIVLKKQYCFGRQFGKTF